MISLKIQINIATNKKAAKNHFLHAKGMSFIQDRRLLLVAGVFMGSDTEKEVIKV